MLSGLIQVVPPEDITAIVNVGDDLVLHGLAISPDLDTITYTLAGEIDPDRGWGLRDETWQAMQTLGRYGNHDRAWFNLGDRDLGTHLYRTARLAEGAKLTEVTAEITSAWGLSLRLLPVSNDAVRTLLTVADPGSVGGAERLSFQEYFVGHHHSVAIRSVEFAGAEHAVAAPGVIEAIESAQTVVVAPSNPLVSIDPVLAVPGVRAAIERRRDSVVAVSPIIAGAALKGPADRLLAELGHEVSAVGVARHYSSIVGTLVIDEADSHLASQVQDLGVRCVVAPTIMSGPAESAALARTVLASSGGSRP